ncbi:MAG: flagellar hook protein FlgE [Deltaproteobacteria bacterium]|nr:flagellar hook protein FlgE [Deltaproteobacteria bacterium]
MLTSLFTAISGMDANGTELSVIGDNIANMNTVGFKKSRVAFGDVLSQSITNSAGSVQVGRGVFVQEVGPLFTQGAFETTENALDLAIDGDGFFTVNDNGARYYTRAGHFEVNRDGYIVNSDSQRLQGYLADPSGNITGTNGDLQVIATQSPALITGSANVAVNLNAALEIETNAFTLDGDGDGTSNDPLNYSSSTTLSVYDSQGGTHQVTLYYTKTDDNEWDVHYVYQDPADTSRYLEATNSPQTLTFDTDGNLTGVTGSDPVFDFGTSVTANQSIDFDHTGTMQFASNFAVLKLDQDGYPSGSLRNLVISDAGMITGIFTNGQTRVIGQVTLAKFIAPTELAKLGRNLYAESYDSGQPIISAPATSGLGKVASNTLELSNVDLAVEFVKMISAQRGFQANSRIITATDDLMQEVVNLKR